MNLIPSETSYTWGAGEPCNFRYLVGPVLARLRRHGARTVLDIGCGNGALARAMADAGFEVAGIEPSAEGVEQCRHAVPAGRFQRMSVYDRPDELEGGGFDAAVATEVVEHLFHPRALPRFARAKLREGGILLVTTPYHGYGKNLALSLANRWDFHHGPLWDGGHIKFWSEKTLRALIEPEGFAFLSFTGCGRVPFLWKSMLLTFRNRPAFEPSGKR